MSNIDWHQRYRQQAAWTRPTREYLLSKMGILPSAAVLEVGCGTGAIGLEMPQTRWYGVDNNRKNLRIATNTLAGKPNFLVEAEAAYLPYARDSFELAYGHYISLWLPHPEVVIAEMRRVVRPGGWVAMFAEPDYLARIDAPSEMARFGIEQNRSLRQQGCTLDAGRKLAGNFVEAGLTSLHFGVIGGEWQPGQQDHMEEQLVLENDLEYLRVADKPTVNDAQFVYVPTFYAIGKVP